MKRKAKAPKDHFFFLPVRLYLDDLEEILQMMGDMGFEVNISDANYEFDSLDEIKQYRGTKVHNLSLNASEINSWQNIQIEFSRSKTSLFLHGESKGSLLLWHQVEAFLRRKLCWHQKVFDPRIWFYLLLVSPFSFIFFTALEASPTLVEKILWILIPCVLFPFLVSLIWFFLFPGIYVDRRFRILNFWQRNRDSLLLLLLGGLIGAFAKWIFDLILTN